MMNPLLLLAWLILAHLASDFLLQTGRIARAKAASGSRAIGGLGAHGLIVAICLVPVGLALGGVGWVVVALVAISHVIIDRTKIVLTRRAAASALREARDRHEGPQPPDHLGRAWTPRPAALFLADQAAHLAVLGIAVALVPPNAGLQSGWIDVVNRVLGGQDRAAVHAVVSVTVVFAILLIVNIRAASLFVSILVRPVEQSGGETRWGGRVAPATNPSPTAPPGSGPSAPRRWSVRIGPLDARIEAEPDRSPADPAEVAGLSAPSEPGSGPMGANARVGATIGVLERILIVVFVLTGSEAAVGFVVAAKTLARFRLLDDRDFAEYYLLGTLASVAVAIVSGLAARAALATLLA
ncbi:MAG TPA: DUF3307 domain-containing protein [Candidatus Limnocylindrales bacterium]|nr:DUF3307 domain-containing protein [Candidatus Limnocylindrales bacterium]